MAKVDTVNALLRPMMGKPSVRFDPPRCAVCGSSLWCENHHPVRRGAGTAYDDAGRELAKPTVMLCKACHQLAHQNRLHFRWEENRAEKRTGMGTVYASGGHWEWIELGEPAKYQTALGMDGWKRFKEEA